VAGRRVSLDTAKWQPPSRPDVIRSIGGHLLVSVRPGTSDVDRRYCPAGPRGPVGDLGYDANHRSGNLFVLAASTDVNGFLIGMAVSGLGFGVYVAVDLALVTQVLPD
jgi:hypothetical protein